ncbi:MAG: TIGR03619 family F420-dependent LLM class oxidoreductase [Actinomycetota bacterium]|nr:TIGR03619 family F420-dependent LLM class oxidoreductase [Actinomycetota bacterium]
MKLGLFGINMGALGAEPERAVEAARAAEAAGWESVWTGEHFAIADPTVARAPVTPDSAILEPFVALANIAAHTTSLLLGTGVTVLPLYQPLALAKQVASLDRISAGRLLLGVGAGYYEPEFAAFGIPLESRASRVDEMLGALPALWSQETPTIAFQGRTIAGLRAEPRPFSPAGPPIHIGGHAAAAARRAVTHGTGWYGYSLSPDKTAAAITRLREAQARYDRPAHLGELEISITPPHRIPLDLDLVKRYADLGVSRLIMLAPGETHEHQDELLTFISAAPHLLPT